MVPGEVKALGFFRGLIEAHTLELVTAALTRYLESEDEFVVNAGWSLGVFRSRFNALIAPRRQKRATGGQTGISDDWTEQG